MRKIRKVTYIHRIPTYFHLYNVKLVYGFGDVRCVDSEFRVQINDQMMISNEIEFNV